MRIIRHSSVSASPVETAMSGMLSSVSPAATVLGSESDLSGCALAWHAVHVDVQLSARHLPTWMTSGTFVPDRHVGQREGPVDGRRRAHDAPLLKSAPHEQASAPVGTPVGSGCSGARRDVDRDVVERVLSGGVVDLARDRGRAPARTVRSLRGRARVIAERPESRLCCRSRSRRRSCRPRRTEPDQSLPAFERSIRTCSTRCPARRKSRARQGSCSFA